MRHISGIMDDLSVDRAHIVRAQLDRRVSLCVLLVMDKGHYMGGTQGRIPKNTARKHLLRTFHFGAISI